MIQNIEQQVQELSNKLDVMIGLLQDIGVALTNKNSIRYRVSYLAARGLTNKEIARALAISEKHVSKEKSVSNKLKQEEYIDGREEIV